MVNKNYKRAFSFVEMSATLLIIGVLLGMVVVGKALIPVSRLASARILTNSSVVSTTDNLVLWLETTSKDSFDEDERIDGDSISTWYDISLQSTSQYDAEQTTSSLRPTYDDDGINSLPSLRFSDSEYFTTDDIASVMDQDNGISIFLVTMSLDATSGTNTTNVALSFHDASGTDVFRLGFTPLSASSNADTLFFAISSGTSFSTATGYYNSPKINRVIKSANSTFDIYTNGSSVLTSAGSSTFTTATQLSIGQEWDSSTASDFFNGQIGEIIIYERTLSSYEIELIEEYLSAKWNIDLD